MRRFLGYCLLCVNLIAISTDSQAQFNRNVISSNLSSAYWVYATDIDGDGDNDLVTASSQGIDWWRNNGGSFSKSFLGSLQNAWGAHAADIDGDGDVDILGVSPGTDEVVMWRNNGSQNFSRVLIEATNDDDPESVWAADLDGDGDRDIVVALWKAGQIVWYENNGGSNFTRRTLDGNVSGAHAVTAADFDGDGDMDVAGSGASRVFWYANNGSGGFSRRNVSGSGALGLYAVNIDGDGDIDLLRTQRNNGDIDVFRNSGGGGFSEVTIQSGYGDSWSVAGGDIDGDGDVDVAAAGFSANNITVWYNNGGVNFGPPVVVDDANTVRGVFIASLNGNSKEDVVAAIRDDSDLIWYEESGTPPPPSKTITVDDPNGGEVLTVGESFDIRWSSTGSISNVQIEYSTNNGSSWSTIINSTNNDGFYSWTVPDDPTDQGRVRVSEAGNSSVSDQSNGAFTIEAAVSKSITVTDPNGGETLEVGADFDIRWNSSGSISSVRLEYSTDNGSSWSTILNSTKNDGFHRWTVPNSPTNQGLIRITDASDGSVQDVSDNPFTISELPKELTVTDPNGGEDLEVGSNYIIRWNSSGDISNVRIEFSADNGGSWTTVLNTTTNDGQQNWTVPTSPTNQGLIRITDTGDGSVQDISDDVFTISEPPKNITVTDPNGGEDLETGSSYTIQWNSSGDISNVRIEFSADNGGSWTTVLSTTNNDGQQNWTIPSSPTSQGLIRITDVVDATVLDVSDDVFTISEPPRNITVLAPNGGEEILTGERFDILWNTTGDIDNVRIEFSGNAGTDWTSVVNSTENDGSHTWSVPDSVTDAGLIRISDVDDVSVSDVSDDVFIISEPPRDITVVAPNGGEAIQLQSVFAIQWTSTGDIPQVEIEFSPDNGQSWNPVVDSTENDGKYDWTVPDTTIPEALVRISDANDAAIFDVSDAPFIVDDLITPPVISDVHATDVTWLSARVTWSTDEPSDSQVEYGVDSTFANLTPNTSELTTFHSILLTGLQPGTTYSYRVMSRDVYGNLSVSAEYRFTTLESSTNDAGFALSFDGVDDFVEIPDSETLSGGPDKSITVEAWVRLFSLVQEAPVVMKLFDYATKDWGLRINDEGMIQIDIENQGDNWSYEVGEFVVGPWTHIAATFDNQSDTVRIFMNGEEVGEGAGFSKDMPNSDATVLFGRHNYSDIFLNGEIDEVRIWDHARTRLQIQQNMNQSLDGTQAGLLGLWKFDEGQGQSALDLSGNELHGQLSGGDDGPDWMPSDAPIGGMDVEQFEISVSSIGPGHIELSPDGGIYDDGSVVTVTAVPDSGAWFYGWFDGFEGKENPITVTMNQDITLNAAFVRLKRIFDTDETEAFSKQLFDDTQIPEEVMLLPGYPNPFNPEVRIRFGLPEAGHVNLAVYNIRGQLVQQLMDGQELAGMKEVRWNGTNDLGRKVASGVYIIRMKAGEVQLSRKITLQR